METAVKFPDNIPKECGYRHVKSNRRCGEVLALWRPHGHGALH